MTPTWLTELQCAKAQQSFLLCLHSKDTGERATAFGHCSSEEDTLMPVRMVHSWEVCDMGWVLLQQKGPPMLVVLQESCQDLCGLRVTPVGQKVGCAGPEATSTGSLISTAAENQENSSAVTFPWQDAISWSWHFLVRNFVLRFPVSCNHKECTHGKLPWPWGRIHIAWPLPSRS